jgi:hypothetical protein
MAHSENQAGQGYVHEENVVILSIQRSVVLNLVNNHGEDNPEGREEELNVFYYRDDTERLGDKVHLRCHILFLLILLIISSHLFEVQVELLKF